MDLDSGNLLDRSHTPWLKTETAKDGKIREWIETDNYYNVIGHDDVKAELTWGFIIEYTVTMRQGLRALKVEDANKCFKRIFQNCLSSGPARSQSSNSLFAYIGKRNIQCYNVLEKHKTGHYHSHGVIRFCKGGYDDYLGKVAALSKWFTRRGCNLRWTRINRVDKLYRPTEGNLKRKSALFDTWWLYIHKSLDIDNVKKCLSHNMDFHIEGPQKGVPQSFRILFS